MLIKGGNYSAGIIPKTAEKFINRLFQQVIFIALSVLAIRFFVSKNKLIYIFHINQ